MTYIRGLGDNIDTTTFDRAPVVIVARWWWKPIRWLLHRPTRIEPRIEPTDSFLCECGHYIWSHVTTKQRRGCFPNGDTCTCKQFTAYES